MMYIQACTVPVSAIIDVALAATLALLLGSLLTAHFSKRDREGERPPEPRVLANTPPVMTQPYVFI